MAGLGHAHPALVEAICRQAGRLMICANTVYNDKRSELAAKLVEITIEAIM